MVRRLTLYYETGWVNPVLHYGFQGQGWQDAAFVRASGEPGWWQVSVPATGSQMEFVPRAEDSSGWDNPAGGGNYPLIVPAGSGPVVAVLCQGQTSIVNLDRPPWALVADMDGTLIGEPLETVERLRLFWNLHCRFAVRASDGSRLCQLVYNSGRNRMDMLSGCRNNDLPRPDWMVCGVGTEIYRPCPQPDGDPTPWYDLPRLPEPEPDWTAKMSKEFGDRDKLGAEVQSRFPALEVHGSVEHDPYRIPCIAKVTPEDPNILEQLQAWGDAHETLRVIISGMGEARFVDVCSVHADKGLAVEHLFAKGAFKGIPDKSRILMAGDSGNDLRMFMVPGVRSVIVGNSQPQLVEEVVGQATEPSVPQAVASGQRPLKIARRPPLLEVYYASGIIGDGVCEAIRHYFFDE